MTEQRSLGNRFGAQSTANDVLSGIDLTSRTALVTGGYSGLGLETTRALARAGACVIVPARRPAAAHEALDDLPGTEVHELDLAELASVRAFAAHFLETGRPLDIVIAGAGIMACPETRVGPGWEAQFAVNHLGHYALVNLLWPAIADGGARVVAVSSGAHHITDIRWDDIHFRTAYDRWTAYGQSKTANVLFAVGLDARGRPSGVRAFATHPGSILTPLQRHLSQQEMVDAGWIDEHGNCLDPSFKTPEQGAATHVWAATSPHLADHGGVYCEDCEIAPIVDGSDATPGGVRPYAIDEAAADRLWAVSAELTGCDAFTAEGLLGSKRDRSLRRPV
jgi:NAD(P)-dependent dehydrogenase (short-subunit alcohol dehydrogenase family)